jgi:uncharacterized protein
MGNKFAQLAFTAASKDLQSKLGSRDTYEHVETAGRTQDRLGPSERQYIASRDSFYMASVSETGWPYVQFRGGQPGFLEVVDEKTLRFADLRGNRQYISAGNLSGNDRVALILMDYPHQTRLKILGNAEILEGRNGKQDGSIVERMITIHVQAFDWNCPQHITPRFTEKEIEAAVQPLKDRIQVLEEENARLKMVK